MMHDGGTLRKQPVMRNPTKDFPEPIAIGYLVVGARGVKEANKQGMPSFLAKSWVQNNRL